MTVIIFKKEDLPINQTKIYDWRKIPLKEIFKMVELQARWEREIKNNRTVLYKFGEEIEMIINLRMNEE